jgi:outer membrane protein assembly factor BamB
MTASNDTPRRAVAIAAALLFVSTASIAADWPQWRGPRRDGVSSETGLLKAWPKEGPALRWAIKDCGAGYSTPSVVGARLYLLGNEGLDNEFVQALDAQDGHRLWRTRLGKVGNPDQQPKFPAARSTPTIEGNALYVLGSDGDLACLAADSGAVRWTKNLRTEFGGKPGKWAYAESPLVDGDLLLCTPGGTEATLLALNKQSGAILWKSALAEGDEAAYASAIGIELDGARQYVQMLQKGLVGVSAKDGRFLWRYDKTVSRYGANIPTPLARGNLIYSAGAGTGGGAVRLKTAGDGVVVEPVYFSPKLPAAVGGSVLVGDHLYGTGNTGMLCVELATGAVKWEDRALGAASLCVADGRLYLHAESGEVALVEANPEAYRELGRFTPSDLPGRAQQMEKAWAYPVVAGGSLYVRDLDRLWSYRVKSD